MSEHEGNVVVVTGAASGIGRAVAMAFAHAGASVVVADLDDDGARAIAAQIGERALPIRCDVTEEAQVEAAVAAAVGALGRLDVMVNNAGICVLAPLHQLAGEDFDRMIGVNLKGTWTASRRRYRTCVKVARSSRSPPPPA